jgi:hypothetical protein
VSEATDYFYSLKDHLSNKTVRNDKKKRVHKQGAYEQAIEHFINLNAIWRWQACQLGGRCTACGMNASRNGLKMDLALQKHNIWQAILPAM